MSKKKTIRIVMPHIGDGLDIAKTFGCTPQTVSNALHMRSMKSKLAHRIRQYALNHGGQEIKEIVL